MERGKLSTGEGRGAEDTPTHSQNSRAWDRSAVVSEWGVWGGTASSAGWEGPALGRVWPRTLDLAWGIPGGGWLQIASASAPPANQLLFKSLTPFYFFKLSGLFLATLMSVRFPGHACLASSAPDSLALCGSS